MEEYEKRWNQVLWNAEKNKGIEPLKTNSGDIPPSKIWANPEKYRTESD